MARISKRSSPSIACATSTSFRKTRNSVFGSDDFRAPYQVVRHHLKMEKLVHSVAWLGGQSALDWSCCRAAPPTDRVPFEYCDDAPSTCFACVLCGGCPACRDGHIDEHTMRMGKWETKDGRTLYPFEMDHTHLKNSIAKLKRDKTHFKDDWKVWVTVLETEATRRGLL